MAGMTGSATDLTVLARRGCPLVVDFVMARGAGRRIGSRPQGDLQGHVNVLVAIGAGFDRLGRIVSLVAFEAGRNVAVRIVMTGCTTQLGMRAGRLGHLVGRPAMAVRANGRQLFHRRCSLRRMGIGVATGTGGLQRPMRRTMAGAALRHQFGVIAFQGVVAMKLLMAFLAGKAMSAAGRFQAVIGLNVAPAAFDRGHGLGFVGVKLFGNLRQRPRGLGGFRRPERDASDRQKTERSAQKDTDAKQHASHNDLSFRRELLAGPVVQIMRRVVTVAALREFGVHGCRMRHAMTIAALRDHAVLIDMAGDAGNLVVLGRARRQFVVGRCMARGAKLGTGILTVGQFEGFVSLVAGRTVGLDHGFPVGGVTVDAVGDIAVGVGMAEVTGHFGMHAGTGGHLLAGTGMAGLTDCLELTFQVQVERLVGIVAAHAFRDLVMTGSSMTVAAEGNVVGDHRLVTLMTGRAVNFGFVGGAGSLDLGRLLDMTLVAVIGGQDVLLRQDRKRAAPQQKTA